ncbi:MAG: SDR family NAD(P)-dependent oxidoreductase, partial [Thermodesulfobacteriota bacterium]
RPLQLEAEEAARLTTLRGIINLVSQESGAGSAGEPSDAAPIEEAKEASEEEAPQALDVEPESSGIKRFLLKTEERPLVPTKLPSLAEQPVIVTCDPKHTIAEQVIRRLRDMNDRVVVLQHGKQKVRRDPGHYEADLTCAEHVGEIVEEIGKEKGPVGGLIHLVPLSGGRPFEEMTLSEWKERLARDVKSLFYLTKFLADDMEACANKGGGSVVAVTGMGGAFASDPSSVRDSNVGFPGSGGVPGFLKALSEEWPRVNIRCMDVDFDNAPEDLGDRILGEFLHSSEEVEVGYLGAKRHVISLREETHLHRGDDRANVVIDSSSVLLITGGARGITSTIALKLAERYGPVLLLVGRSEEPAAEELEATRGVEDRKQLKSILLAQLSETNKSVKPVEIERAYQKILRER